jgi:ABC-type lipoprotein export system ATPase subunit
MDLMVSLNEAAGQTFVLVTHDSNIANRTDRIIYMTDGLIVDEKITERRQQRDQGQAENEKASS